MEEREYAATAIAEHEFADLLAFEEEDVAALLFSELDDGAGHELLEGQRWWNVGLSTDPADA